MTIGSYKNVALAGGGASFKFELGNTNDKLLVNGSMELFDALVLTAIDGFAPNDGDIFFLIENDGSDPITSRFSGGSRFHGYEEGFEFFLDDALMKVTYQADSITESFTGGNDFALLAVPEPSTAGMLVMSAFALLSRTRPRRKIGDK